MHPLSKELLEVPSIDALFIAPLTKEHDPLMEPAIVPLLKNALPLMNPLWLELKL
jgi:hypothetical protein